MSSDVTSSAAMVRSPSFSRSSSSQMMTISPRVIASIASGILEKGFFISVPLKNAFGLE